MSRRPAVPDRSEQNRATLKQLVKLEPNKSCADCKRNKHPRWASWNLGVFVCIRCSGIHRSLGVHISRVKSVDLDTWTEEQMASILKWGNARANKYWEAKLAPGHIPNEAKIENFIRTKYDSKRWVMDGPMPDPATLDDEGADDDVPLNVVQEKVKVERSASLRNGGGLAQPRAPPVDLFGDEPAVAPARPNTTEPATGRLPPVKAAAAPTKQTKPGESLLGLDFFGNTAAPSRPASATSAASTANTGRADLKNSILSLYASAPKASTATTPAAQGNTQDLFGAPSAPKSNSTALGDLGDAFGGLSFSSNTSPQPPKATPLSTATSPAAVQARPSSILSGGSFFESKPALPPKPTSPPAPLKQNDSFGDFGGFESTSTSKPAAPARSPAATKSASSAMGDLFDLSTPAQPAPPPAKQPPPISASNYASAAAFNLSQPKAAPAPVQTQAQASTSSFSALSNMDAWGSNDAWATPDPAPVASTTTSAAPVQASSTTVKTSTAAPTVTTSSGGWGDTGGWGEPDPTPVKPAASTPGLSSGTSFTVQQDEEFGGWSHASPVATTNTNKSSGLGGTSDDLFGNVWN